MGVPGKHHGAGLQRGRLDGVIQVAVGQEKAPTVRHDAHAVGHQGKRQHHLIHLGVAVAAHGGDLVRQRVEHGDDLFCIIIVRQGIARAVVQDIAQQQKPVGALAPPGLHQPAHMLCRAVQIRRDHVFHIVSLPVRFRFMIPHPAGI